MTTTTTTTALYAVGDQLVINEEGSRRLGLDVGWDAGTVTEVVALSRLGDDFYYVTTNRPAGLWESFVEPAKPVVPTFKVGDKVLVTADSNCNGLKGKEGVIVEQHDPGSSYYEDFDGLFLVTTDASVTYWSTGICMNVQGNEMEHVVETIEVGDRVTGTGYWTLRTREGVLESFGDGTAILSEDDGGRPIVKAESLELVSKAPKPLTVDDVLALAQAVKAAQSEVSDAEADLVIAEAGVKLALEALEAANLKVTEASASLSAVTSIPA